MVELSPLAQDDSPILYSWLSDREYRLDSGGFEFIDWESHCQWFQRAQQGATGVALAVRRSEDQTLVGLVQLVAINRVYRNAELRIRLAPDQLGKGYGTEATRLLCAHGFDDLNLHRIYLHVRAKNPRAIRCYEKVGFQVEGTLREHCYVDGAYDDFVVLGVLRDEFL